MGFEQRVTRRALLRVGSRTIIGITASRLFLTPLAARAEPYALRFTWEQRDIALADAPITSPTLVCDFAFNAIESEWDADLPPGASLDLSVRTQTPGDAWSDWMHLHIDDHARDDADSDAFGDLIIVAPATQLQYRIDATANADGDLPVIRAFILTAINTLDESMSEIPDMSIFAATNAGVKIIPRAGWGADERLRFDKKQQEIWPPEYRPIQKVVIHHTVTGDPDPNPSATIRAIYQYHAVARGWGDIGYNYLIDPNGNIYEGRFGGPGVIGGHTLGYNNGSMGIAMLGTYLNHTIASAARTALKALIKAKAGDLDPLGKSFFINRDNVWNINGHRALTQTECPGDGFYLTLNNLRRELKGLPLWTGDPHTDPLAANPADASDTPPKPRIQPTPAKPAETFLATLQGVSWSTTTPFSRDVLTVNLTIKNTGTATIPASKPAPNFVYTEGDTYAKKGYPATKGALRIAIGPTARSGDPPYRWGLDRALAPGQSVKISVPLRLLTPGRVDLLPALLRESYGTLDKDAPQTIMVAPNPADPVAAAQAKEDRYFAETKHTIGGAFRAYWETNGGSTLFGLPLTEAFAEKSADDGKTDTVQYFERARFELPHGKAELAANVELGRLGTAVIHGRESEQPFKRVAAVTDSATRRYFPEVGHMLSGVFKTYWDTHGGLTVFGFPISETFTEKSAADGKTYTVQYFERNRLEHHPENAGKGDEIVLGLLGSEILRTRGWLT
jgi:hypothetical protein